MKLKLIEPLKDLFKDEVRGSGATSECPRRSCNASHFRAPV